MVTSIGGNIAALKAFGVKMGVAAHNVANVNTDEFSKNRVVMEEGVSCAVNAVIPRSAAGKTAEVDLAEEITGMIPTQAGYEANLKTIKTRDEMAGTVIDLIG